MAHARFGSMGFLDTYRQNLLKSIAHLEYSQKKARKLPFHLAQLDEESLEIWESFSARFSWVADLFLSKYLRLYVESQEPGFRGTFIDYLNQAEKIGLVQQTELWIEIRKLCNLTAHEYNEEAFDEYIQHIFKLSDNLIALKGIL